MGTGATGAGVDRIEIRTAIEVDDRRWPILAIRWPGRRLSDADVAVALQSLRSIATRPGRHAVLLDAEEALAPSRTQLGMILDLVRFAATTSSCQAVAIVTRSFAVRATVDSLRWMTLTPWRWEVFQDEIPAMRWLERQATRGRDESGTYPRVSA